MSQKPHLLQLLKGSSVYFVGNAATAALSFLSVTLLTRLLSPADYGIASLFVFYSSIAHHLAFFGANVPVLARYHTTEAAPFSRLLTSVTHVILAFCALIAVGILICITLGRTFLVETFGPWGLLCAVSALAQCLFLLRQTVFQARDQAANYIAIQIFVSAGALALSFAFAPLFELQWQARVLAVLATQMIAGLIAVRHLSSEGLIQSRRPEWSGMKTALKLGAPATLYSFGILFANQMDLYFVIRNVGNAAGGVYGLGVQVAAIVESASVAFNRAYTSGLSKSLRNSRSIELKTWVAPTAWGLIVLSAVALGVIAAAPLILEVMAPEKYHAAGSVIPLLSFRAVLQGALYALISIAVVLEAGWVLTGSALIGGLATMGLSAWLSARDGMEGAARGALLGAGVNLMATLIFVAIAIQRRRVAR
jgi:O-antigen/teichoic acid export membrane protein